MTRAVDLCVCWTAMRIAPGSDSDRPGGAAVRQKLDCPIAFSVAADASQRPTGRPADPLFAQVKAQLWPSRTYFFLAAFFLAFFFLAVFFFVAFFLAFFFLAAFFLATQPLRLRSQF